MNILIDCNRHHNSSQAHMPPGQSSQRSYQPYIPLKYWPSTSGHRHSWQLATWLWPPLPGRGLLLHQHLSGDWQPSARSVWLMPASYDRQNVVERVCPNYWSEIVHIICSSVPHQGVLRGSEKVGLITKPSRSGVRFGNGLHSRPSYSTTMSTAFLSEPLTMTQELGWIHAFMPDLSDADKIMPPSNNYRRWNWYVWQQPVN